MSGYKTPSKSEVIAALSKLHTLQHRRVFFEGLRNPLWVRPLMTAKAFDHPPQPTVDEAGYIREEYWPQANYLTRMAPHVPGDVVDVLRRLQDSKNSWVRRATFEIARAIPVDQASRLKEVVQAWNPDFGWRTDPTDLTAFGRALLESTHSKFGVSFAYMLFAPRASNDGARKPATTLEEYWYIQELPATVTSLGKSALSIVTAWLEWWEEFAGHFSEKMDITSIARSDIGNRDERYVDVEQALIESVRDLAVRDIAIDAESVARTLQGMPMILLRKILLHAAAQAMAASSAPDPTLIKVGLGLLADSQSHDSHCRVEFADLFIALRKHDQPVDESLQHALDAGPLGSREALAETIAMRESVGKDVETRVVEEMELWQQHLLATIGAEHLPQPAANLLASLDSRLGAIKSPREPNFKFSSWTGPTSPTTREELAEMSPDALVSHLESWRAGDAWMSPTHDGMGRVLEELVAESPEALHGTSDLAKRLRPTYLRAIVSGWTTAWKNGLSLDWPEVLGVATDILAHGQETDIETEGDDFDDDPDFKHAQQTTIRFLVDVARPTTDHPLPRTALERIAELLLDSATDEPAWVEYNERPRGQGSDPLTISLNWQWPIMLRGLIHLSAHGPNAAWSAPALAALERELLREDEAGAGAAVVGEGFAQLFNNNPDWLAEHIDSLFGSEHEFTRAQQISLTTTLATHHVHPKILELLRRPVLIALQAEEPLAVGWRDDPNAQELIGRWIVTCIIWGAINPDDPLATTFFTTTSPETRGAVVGHMAWSFMHSDQVDPDIRTRLENLWDSRVNHVRSTPSDSAELNDFYWFVRSKKFDTSWWLPRLCEAAELDPTLSTRGMIGEQLAAEAQQHPREVLDALRFLIGRNDESGAHDYDLREHAAPTAIAAALDSGDDALEKDGTRLMHKLGDDGMIDLKARVNKLRDT